MKCTAKELLQYVEENDVKFVKLTFCDLFGRHKNVSLVSQQLPLIFENGYLFNSSAVRGFTNCAGDLLLFPDPKTLSVLPWRPQMGEVISLLAYIKRPDDSFYEGDTLHLLDAANQKLHKLGLTCEIATDCEFYIFKLDSDGVPTTVPIDRAGYLDCAPYDEGENVRRDIILNLEDMGIIPTASHHEEGPGQNEIDFMPTEPSSAAKNFLYFKSAVRNVCRLNGMYATFEPKPLENSAGSGLRITLTLRGIGDKPAAPALLDSFSEGVLSKANDITSVLYSTAESYVLLDELRAPAHDSERRGNASGIRVLNYADGRRGIEVNSADCMCNPFLAFALLLEAGLYGIEKKLKLRSVAEVSDLPRNLSAALDCAEKSEWLGSVIPKEILSEYVRELRAERKAKNP